MYKLKYVFVIFAFFAWILMPLVPSIVLMRFHQGNFGLLGSGVYWATVLGSICPWFLSLLVFLLIYTVNKSGGEGGIGGLFFIFAGMLAVAIMTTKLVYNVQPSGKVAFLYSLRQSSLPLLAIIAVGGAISVIAFILIRTGILKN